MKRVWMATLLGMVSMYACAQGQSSSAQAQPAAISPTMKNPVKPTPQSQAKAKALFSYDCVSCHGEKGNGKGDLAKDMGITVPDFTDPATLKGIPDATLFTTIHDGKGPMPEEGDRAKTDEIWNLVLYVRSFAQKPAAAAPAPAPAPAATPAAH